MDCFENSAPNLLDAYSQSIPARVRRVLANKICAKPHVSNLFGRRFSLTVASDCPAVKRAVGRDPTR